MQPGPKQHPPHTPAGNGSRCWCRAPWPWRPGGRGRGGHRTTLQDFSSLRRTTSRRTGLYSCLLRVGLLDPSARGPANPLQARKVVLALAFMVIIFTGVGTDIRLRRSENIAAAMAQLKKKLPPGQELVSIDGHAPTGFAYYYGGPTIIPGSWPMSTMASTDDPSYFCFRCSGDKRPQLGFAWEELGAISLDRNHHAIPQEVVVVGRCLQRLKEWELAPSLGGARPIISTPTILLIILLLIQFLIINLPLTLSPPKE